MRGIWSNLGNIVDNLKVLLRRASPGPWLANKHMHRIHTAQLDKYGEAYDSYYFGPPQPEEVVGDNDLFETDAVLIVEIRNSLPKILEALEAIKVYFKNDPPGHDFGRDGGEDHQTNCTGCAVERTLAALELK